MSDPPLDQSHELEELKTHLLNINITTIWDISVWNQDSSWKDCNIPCPLQMIGAKRQLLQMLKGKSPIASHIDSKGWGNRSGKYTTAASYQLLVDATNHDNTDLWKSIWATKSLPKIDFFTWTTRHDKLLTEDNL